MPNGEGEPSAHGLGEGIRPEAGRYERRALRREEPLERARLPGVHRHAVDAE